MAFAMNPEAQSVFFSKVFGVSHEVTQKAKELVTAGVTFELAMYTVKAQFKGKQYSVGTTKGTTSLMKHVIEPAIAEQNKKLIAEWVVALHKKVVQVFVAPNVPVPLDETVAILMGVQAPMTNLLPLIKAVQTVTGVGLADAKKIAEAALSGTPQHLKQYPNMGAAHVHTKVLEEAGGVVKLQAKDASMTTHVEPHATAIFGEEEPKVTMPSPTAQKPVDAVIDLKQATAIGQKVHGTSAGSVYHCIAISEHVKVAARLYKGGGISIRAEWTDSPTKELKLLQDSGLQMKPNYGSIHFDAADVPLQRVIGAFLVGTGINWKAAVMNGAELVIGDKM